MDDFPSLPIEDVIGIVVAISGNVLISLALNLQKLAHKRLDAQKCFHANRSGQDLCWPPDEVYRTDQVQTNETRTQTLSLNLCLLRSGISPSLNLSLCFPIVPEVISPSTGRTIFRNTNFATPDSLDEYYYSRSPRTRLNRQLYSRSVGTWCVARSPLKDGQVMKTSKRMKLPI